MSGELSSAALRRTSCERWPSAPDGRSWMAMVYSPFDAAECSAAAALKLPDTSGKMYQFSVGAPPALWSPPPPQAASMITAASARTSLRRHRRVGPARALAPAL
jgi:hypothetical protein